jgi:exopolyphosphatase / guanosine-5'-triphosphate,3'-diphosphate pyrophosphatase
LDVGSNTIHLLVVDAHHGGAPTPVHSHKAELRLAEGLDNSGAVDERTVHALVDFIRESQEIAEDSGVAEIFGFATSALREARNGLQVLGDVADRTGVSIELLSGDDEARLTFLAARRWFGWSSGRLLVADIGGGSLEVAVGADEEPDEVMSLPLGAGLLTRGFITGDPPGDTEIKELRKYVRSETANMVSRFTRLGAPEMAVATSKTFRQLARVTGAAPSAEGPYVRRVLQRDALEDWLPKLAAMTEAERAELPGVSRGRAGQLLAGGIVALAVMDLFDQAELVLCPWALREGVILRLLDAMAA